MTVGYSDLVQTWANAHDAYFRMWQRHERAALELLNGLRASWTIAPQHFSFFPLDADTDELNPENKSTLAMGFDLEGRFEVRFRITLDRRPYPGRLGIVLPWYLTETEGDGDEWTVQTRDDGEEHTVILTDSNSRANFYDRFEEEMIEFLSTRAYPRPGGTEDEMIQIGFHHNH